MIRGRIEFTGETDSDVETAVEAALRSIRYGYTSGFDRNETGSYHFELNEDGAGRVTEPDTDPEGPQVRATDDPDYDEAEQQEAERRLGNEQRGPTP